MKMLSRILPTLALAALLSANAETYAQENSAAPTVSLPSTSTAPAAPIAGTQTQSPAPIVAKPAPTSTPAATTAAVTAPTPPPAKPLPKELKDGTPIEISEDGTVTIINADNTKTPAPDGIFTLKDDSNITVKDGKKTDE